MYSNVFLEERTYANFVFKSDWGSPNTPTTVSTVVFHYVKI